MYSEKNIVRVAKRENNTRRPYLVVNCLQGKHIPVKPYEALDMFRALAAPLKERYAGEQLLVIGFAETATAIGATVAVELKSAYMQTTREAVSGVEFLYFSEEHSHATQQKLVKNDIDRVIGDIGRIVFIEDEVTTGKTILNIINILEKLYPARLHFSVASILNGMDNAALEEYTKRDIALFWLVKTSHAGYAKIAETYKGDGQYIPCNTGKDEAAGIHITQQHTAHLMNARRLTDAKKYAQACEKLYQEAAGIKTLQNAQRLLVLGTEEFMYPALFVAWQLERQGKDVRFHAATRSPIAVSMEPDYPLHVRYELKSFYDKERTTYIYDLEKCDCVLVITDAEGDMADGLYSLGNALSLCGNRNMVLIKS